MSESYEFDFHPVGDGTRSGEAITGRFVRGGTAEVIIIDGGTTKSGEEISQRIEKYYGTTVVDYMVLTHADDDHSSGLREILDRCDVKSLWMKRPWLYADALVNSFKGYWTVAGLEKRLRECFPIVAELEEKAIAKGVPIFEPFQGAQIGPFIVTSPSKDFYLELLPNMSRTPDPAVEKKLDGILEKTMATLMKSATAIKAAVLNIFENWDIETLDDDGETSPSNEGSVILYGTIDGRRILLTGDAGQKALERTINFCESFGLPLKEFKLVSIPHHGSRRNVGPTILNRLVGNKVPEGTGTHFTAIVSAAKDDADHPRRVVMNAFKRRGARTSKTEGKVINTRHNFEMRSGFQPTEEIPLYSMVEE